MDNAARVNYSEFIDEKGLVFVQGETLTAQDLAELVHIGESMSTQSAWLRGDVSNLAKDLYGDEWYSYLSYTVSPLTLNNYGSLARKFPRERRKWNLAMRYYDAVKSLEPAQQDALLDRAVKERISSDIIRDLAAEVKNPKTQRLSKEIPVGEIDNSLMLHYGVEAGTIVRVSFEIVKAAA